MSLKVHLAQINPCVGDLKANARLILDAVTAAPGADLVVVPEMALTGYPIEDLALRPSFQRAAEAQLRDLAARIAAAGLGNAAVLVGTLGATASGKPQNIAAVLRGGVVEARYAKRHLPNYGVFDEYRIFEPGEEPLVIEVAGRRVAVAICEDIWRGGVPFAHGVVDALAVLNGSPFEAGKQLVRREHGAARARELGAPVLYANLVGGQDDLVFDGGSFVLDSHGDLVAQAPGFAPAGLSVDLDDLHPIPDAVPSLVRDMYAAVRLGLADYCRKNGFASVVVGLSGGIDSALVATLATDALGRGAVVGVSMPSRFSSQHSRDDAADLAERLGAHYRTVPIEPLVQAFMGEVPLTGVAAENLQARCRGLILMGLSNQEGHLVLAPGNKSELATGYSTIYGDAVGGYAPLKDLYKTQVWALARWRNEQAIDRGEIPPIPESSITKPPSAELRDGQVDTDSLPPYDVLDQVLEAYVERAQGRAELTQRGFPSDVVEHVVRLVDRAEWKRRQYPPGPKVTPVAFGRDRRLPITTRWREGEV